MTAEQEIAEVKESLERMFRVPVGSLWENVFFAHMIVEVVDVEDVGNGENIGVHQPASAGMADNFWHLNIVDFLGSYRRVS